MSLEGGAKAGINIVRSLIPPVDGDPLHRFRYDLAVSLSLVIGGLFVAFHVLWVCGLLTVVGISPPFASIGMANGMQAQVNAQQSILVSIETGQINDKIRAAKKQVCISIQAKNQAALIAWAQELENQKQKYRDVTHREPYVMGCDELLIDGAPSSP